MHQYAGGRVRVGAREGGNIRDQKRRAMQAPSQEQLSEDRADYRRWLIEYGFSDAFVSAVAENLSDHVEMPSQYDAVMLRSSPIHGRGMFTARAIACGEVIAPARLNKGRTHAGRFINHSTRPNAQFASVTGGLDGDLYAIATRALNVGEEVLIDYRQVGKVNGAKPDRTEALSTARERFRRTGYVIADSDLEQFFQGVLLARGYLPSNLGPACCGNLSRLAELVGYLRAGLFMGGHLK